MNRYIPFIRMSLREFVQSYIKNIGEDQNVIYTPLEVILNTLYHFMHLEMKLEVQ